MRHRYRWDYAISDKERNSVIKYSAKCVRSAGGSPARAYVSSLNAQANCKDPSRRAFLGRVSGCLLESKFVDK